MLNRSAYWPKAYAPRTHLQMSSKRSRGYSECYIASLAIFLTLAFLAGVGNLLSTVWMYILSSDIHGLMFQLWVGVPVVVFSLLGYFWLCFRRRFLAIIVTILGVLTVVACGLGALSGGYLFFEGHYDSVHLQMDLGKCVEKDGFCACGNVKMPLKIKTCKDMKTIVLLYITEFSCAAFGCMFTFLSLLFTVRPMKC